MEKIEQHNTAKIVWLRAAVLGANDGIVSVSSLLIGVAAAEASGSTVLLVGISGIVAGAISMAAGEYVSVSSQSDTEKAEIERERKELSADYEFEKKELSEIYQRRGLKSGLADKVAHQLMEYDALGSHCRDELGLSIILKANPMQAAVYSGLSFTIGATLPLVVAVVSSQTYIIISVSIASLLTLGLLGIFSAHVGGARKRVAVTRVIFWGGFAMGTTALIGKLFEMMM